jgi:hypothetical protein
MRLLKTELILQLEGYPQNVCPSQGSLADVCCTEKKAVALVIFDEKRSPLKIFPLSVQRSAAFLDRFAKADFGRQLDRWMHHIRNGKLEKLSAHSKAPNRAIVGFSV